MPKKDLRDKQVPWQLYDKFTGVGIRAIPTISHVHFTVHFAKYRFTVLHFVIYETVLGEMDCEMKCEIVGIARIDENIAFLKDI